MAAMTDKSTETGIDQLSYETRWSYRSWISICVSGLGWKRNPFPREIAEAALAHVVGDKAEQAYRRADALEKRRELSFDEFKTLELMFAIDLKAEILAAKHASLASHPPQS